MRPQHILMRDATAHSDSDGAKRLRGGVLDGDQGITESWGRDPAKPRSTRAEVRNPVLALPSVSALRDLDPAAQTALRALLLDLQRDARDRAERSWRSHKPPLAAYWSAVGVYAGHIARAIGATPGRLPAAGRTLMRGEGEGARGPE
jgi:hypothetical protein